MCVFVCGGPGIDCVCLQRFLELCHQQALFAALSWRLSARAHACGLSERMAWVRDVTRPRAHGVMLLCTRSRMRVSALNKKHKTHLLGGGSMTQPQLHSPRPPSEEPAPCRRRGATSYGDHRRCGVSLWGGPARAQRPFPKMHASLRSTLSSCWERFRGHLDWAPGDRAGGRSGAARNLERGSSENSFRPHDRYCAEPGAALQYSGAALVRHVC